MPSGRSATVWTTNLLDGLPGARYWGRPPGLLRRVCVDSREIREGDLFVGLPGSRVHGSAFAEDALARGARGVLVERAPKGRVPRDRFWIQVPDARSALLLLASRARACFRGPVIAISGSCGKSTTKEAIACALAAVFRVHRAPASYNTEIGVPLTILNAPADADALVLEYGVRKPGDMGRLVGAIHPDIGVLTWIGATHLEFLNTIGQVAQEKLRLLEEADLAVWNADDPRQRAHMQTRGRRYGRNGEVRFRVLEIPEDGRPVLEITNGRGRVSFRSPLVGDFSGYALAAGIAVAESLGVPMPRAIAQLRRLRPLPLRMDVRCFNGRCVLVDAYNSSPPALRLVLQFCGRWKSGRGWLVVFGDMKELGRRSAYYHRKAGEWLLRLPVRRFVGIGSEAAHTARVLREAGKEVHLFPHVEAAKAAWQREWMEDFVLLKGSRAVALEKLLSVMLPTEASP